MSTKVKEAKPLTGTASDEQPKQVSGEKPKRNLRWWSYKKSPSIIHTNCNVLVYSFLDDQGKRVVVVKEMKTDKIIVQIGLRKDRSNNYVLSEFEDISDEPGVKEELKQVAVA